MSSALDALAQDALALPPDRRLALARRLLDSVPLSPPPYYFRRMCSGQKRLTLDGRSNLRRCFGKEFKDETHRSRAIRRNEAKTSQAGMGLDSPASKRAMRRAISGCQAASAHGSGSRWKR